MKKGVDRAGAEWYCVKRRRHPMETASRAGKLFGFKNRLKVIYHPIENGDLQ